MRRLFVALAVLAGLGATAALVFAVYLGSIGGLSGSYRARDGDILLTQIARTASPVIIALARFRAAHQRYPDPARDQDLAELSASLPPGLKATRVGRWLAFDVGAGPVWQYYPDTRTGASYTLSIKLGWDPRLVYFAGSGAGRWVFDPGDGSEQKDIVLQP
jgi:hypothetical protein